MAHTEIAFNTEQDMVAKTDSGDHGQNGKQGAEHGSPVPPKKKRRVVKPNPDKKFECKHEGCGKSYSRAEHLYRHQLNRGSISSWSSLKVLTAGKIPLRPSFAATTRNAVDTLCVRIFVSGIENDTQLMVLNYTREMRSLNQHQILVLLRMLPSLSLPKLQAIQCLPRRRRRLNKGQGPLLRHRCTIETVVISNNTLASPAILSRPQQLRAKHVSSRKHLRPSWPDRRLCIGQAAPLVLP